MHGRGLFRNTSATRAWALLLLLTVAVFALIFRSVLEPEVQYVLSHAEEYERPRQGLLDWTRSVYQAALYNSPVWKRVLREGFPLGTALAGAGDAETPAHLAGGALKALTGVEVGNPSSILSAGIPLLASGKYSRVSYGPVPGAGNEEPADQMDPVPQPLSSLGASPDQGPKAAVEGSPGSDGTAQAAGLSGAAARPAVQGPYRVLLYQSHSSEAYQDSGARYVSNNQDATIVKVGRELTRELEERWGIATLQDRTAHDADSFNQSYTRSAVTVKNALKKYPGLEIILDLHRDGMPRESTTFVVGGKTMAKLYVVVGTDRPGLPHPEWQRNYQFALDLNQRLDRILPGISRGVLVHPAGRFNQNLSKRALLIEVGGNENTMEEALRTVPYLAQAIAEFLGDNPPQS
ncbi:MAG: stage II sporulation protein P [Firmicutes bacterium]|nr:stage II sporulation protein P [Bacillota bacterium]